MSSANFFSLVIPTFNEAENIRPLLEAAHAVLKDQPHEIIVVDDNSPDLTWKIASDFATDHPWVKVVRRLDDRGLSSAVLAGFDVARGDSLGVMDADLSHDERILPSLLAALRQGADMAVGSRRIPGGGAVEWPWYRRWTSSAATLLTRVLLRLELSDPMSGYFVLTRSLYASCKHRLTPRGYKILVEIAAKSRPEHIQEIAYVFKNRKEGYSKLSGRVIQQFLKMLFILSLDQPAQRLRYRYHTGRYKKVAAWLKEGTVLDIGCGQPCETMPDGAFLRFLGRGTGVDVKPCQGPFHFVQGDLLNLPFPEKHFDNVVAMEVFEHVTDPHKAFSEVRRVLKDDGAFVMTVPNETWFWSRLWHVWEHTFGFLWEHTHTGTRHSDEWHPLMTHYFTLKDQRKHWGFNLLFRFEQRAGAIPEEPTDRHSTPQPLHTH